MTDTYKRGRGVHNVRAICQPNRYNRVTPYAMRQWQKISDQRVALYHLRIQHGRYLRDIPLENLSETEKDDLKRCARVLVTKTRLEVRRVRRNRKRVWRFIDVGNV